MPFRYRIICRTCSSDDDAQGCFNGCWSEPSEESYATRDEAEDAAYDEIGELPWDYEVVEERNVGLDE